MNKNNNKEQEERFHAVEESWKEMQSEINAQVMGAMKFAEESPAPEASELYTDVYANPEKNLSPTTEFGHGLNNPLL